VKPGQRILLYTDGVTERRDSTRNQFGTENISRTLRACANATVAGTVRALQDAVLGFSSRPLRDDATILLIGTDRER
jgi:serine phosphatase RsbU (regulator of sigma subunit)